MAYYQAIVAILALFAVALVSGKTFAKEAQVELTATQTSTLYDAASASLALNVTFTLSPPDVQAAIKDLTENKETLQKQFETAVSKISTDAQTALEKLDSLLQNIKTEVQAAGQEVSDELKQRISNAVDKVRGLISLKRQLISAAIDEAKKQLEQLGKQITVVTHYLEDGLKNISKAVNSSRLILQGVKDKVNQAVTKFNNTIHSPEVQTAIQNVVDKLKGQAVGFSDVLKTVGTQLLISGNGVTAALASAVASVLATVSGLIGGLQSLGSLNMDLQIGAGAGATVGAA